MKFRSIKYILLSICIITIMLMSYFVLTHQQNKINKTTAEESSVDDLKYHVNSPDLLGNSFNHGPFFIKSDEMEERNEITTFKKPIVRLMLKHNDWLNITSDSAKLVMKDNQLDLCAEVRANINTQYYLENEHASINTQNSTLSSEIKTILFNEKSKLISDSGFIAFYKKDIANFHGKIDLSIKNEDNSITHVTSEKLIVYWDKKIGDFIDNVVIIKENTIVKANKMLAFFGINSNKLEKLKLYGNVQIINPEEKATSEYGEYTVATNILTLTDKVTLTQEGNMVTGDKLDYNVKTKKATMVTEQATHKKSDKHRARAIIIPKE